MSRPWRILRLLLWTAAIPSLSALPGPLAASDGQLDPRFDGNGVAVRELTGLAGPTPRTLAVARGDLAYTLAARTDLDGKPTLHRITCDDAPATGVDIRFDPAVPNPPPPPVALDAAASAESPGTGTWWTLFSIQRLGQPSRLGVMIHGGSYNDDVVPVMNGATAQEPAGIEVVVEETGSGPEARAVSASNETGPGVRWAVLRRFGASFGEVPTERLWPNGQAAVAFADAEALGVVADPQGRLMVFGRVQELAWIARILPSGDPDPSFDGDGQLTLTLGASGSWVRDEIRRLVIGERGEIVLLGARTDGDGFGRMVLGKLRADGTPETSFGAPPPLPGTGFLMRPEGDLLAGLALQSDGRIVVAGQRGTAQRPLRPAPDLVGVVLVERHLADGSLDPTFGTGGETLIDLARLDPPQDGAIDVTLQGGRVMVYGFSTAESQNGLLFARLTSDLIVWRDFEAGSLAGWLNP